MLSGILATARNLLYPTLQRNTQPPLEDASKQDRAEMVTTRGQSTSQQGTSVDDAIVLDSPRISRKRLRSEREEDAVEVSEKEEPPTTPAKRLKGLPVRGKDGLETTMAKTRVVVEIPVSKIASEVQDLTRESEDEDEDGSRRGEVESDPEQEAEEATPKGRYYSEESEAIDWENLDISDSESGDESRLPEEDTIPNPVKPKKQSNSAPSPKILETTPTSVQPKHKRFDSEDPEPEPEFFSTAVEILDSGEESSDDDAPEVVGAQDALKSAQLRTFEAAKAVEEQENAIRKKKQERDAKLKKQAKAATKRRERAEKTKKTAKKEARQDIHDAEQTAPAEKRTAIDISNLPNLLPDEYLQDDEDVESVADLELEIRRLKPKKIKFSDLVEKKPKDRRKGSTTYRISEVRSKNLAPKASSHARNVKESWLKGRGPMGAGGVRKVASRGFFTKK